MIKYKPERRKTVKGILTQALLIIKAGRWMKRDWRDKKDGVVCYCAAGAIKRCSTNSENATKAFEVLAKTINPDFDVTDFSMNPESEITEWNDRRHRRRRDVIRAIEKALKKL